MILRRLEVQNFRKHRQAAEIRFDEGLTVVHGLNEAGKSTLFVALEYAFFRRSAANATDIELLRPFRTEGLAPRIVLEFQHDGRELRLEKVFGANGTSVLKERVGDGWQLWKEQGTDDYVAEIFAGTPPGKGAFKEFKAEQLGLAHLLFAPQGRVEIETSEAFGTNARARLATIVGAAARTEREGHLSANIEQAYKQHFTPGGKLKKGAESERLSAQIQSLDESITASEQEIAELEALARDLGDEEAQLTILEGQCELARQAARELGPRLMKAIEKRTAFERAAEAFRTATASYDAASLRLREAERAEEQLIAATSELQRQQSALERAKASLESARSADEAARSSLDAALKPDHHLAQLRAVASALREDHRLAAEEQRLVGLASTVQQVDERLSELQDQLAAAVNPTANDIEKLSQWMKQRESLDVRIDAAQTHVAIAAHAPIHTTLSSVQGEQSISLEAGGHEGFSAQGDLSVTIAGVATVTVRGPVADLAATYREREAAEEAIAANRQRFGTDDVGELYRLRGEASALMDEQRRLTQQRRDVLAAEQEDPVPALAAVRAQRERLLPSLQAAGVDPDRIESVIAECERQSEKQRSAAQAAAESARSIFDAAQQHLDTVREELTRAERALADIQAARAKALADCSTLEDLKQLGQDFWKVRFDAEQMRNQCEADFAPYAELGDPKAELDNAERAVTGLDTACRQIAESIANKKARIAEIQRRAPSAEIAQADARRALFQADLERARLNERAIELLRNQLHLRRAEQEDAIAGPVAAIVRPWSERVVDRPIAQISFDNAFATADVGLPDSLAPVPWRLLSRGARDQVALLIRLAFATLIAGRQSDERIPRSLTTRSCTPTTSAALVSWISCAKRVLACRLSSLHAGPPTTPHRVPSLRRFRHRRCLPPPG